MPDALNAAEVKKAISKNYDAIITRDKNDSSRATPPLKAADDAILVDNSNINAEETLKIIIDIIKSRSEE